MNRADFVASIGLHDPLQFAVDILGFRPDPFQEELLRPGLRKALLCCHRGAGKTEIIAVRAAHHCATVEGALVLVASETAEKAAELIQRTVGHLATAGIRVRADRLRRHGVRMENGARILPVPSRAGAVRGYPATMVVIDEAACVPDAVYTALRGTRAATAETATFWVMSTPGARQGFFYDLWMAPDAEGYWTRVHVSATESPRVSAEFLEDERRQMRPDDFAREYLAEFGDTRSTLFREADLRAALDATVPVLGAGLTGVPWGMPVLFRDGSSLPPQGFFFALDLGQQPAHTALAVIEYKLISLGRRDPVYYTVDHDIQLRLRWMELFPCEMPYSNVGMVLGKLLDLPEVAGCAQVVVDATGVGRAVYDQLRVELRGRRVPVVGVQITGGAAVGASGNLVNIPRAEMLLNLEALLREGWLRLAPGCPCLDELLRQMRAYERVPLPGGRMTYTGKGAGGDDLVMALAMGVSYAYQRYGAAFRAREAGAGRPGVCQNRRG